MLKVNFLLAGAQHGCLFPVGFQR